MSDLAKELRELAGREEYLSVTRLGHTKEGQVLIDAANEIDRLTAAYSELLQAAAEVVDNWSGGDLASAVNGLSLLLPEESDATS